MQSSNHIGKFVRKHGEAVESGKVSPVKRKRKSSRVAKFKTVPTHPAFVALITIWCGLLLALIIAVVPDQFITWAMSMTGAYLPLLVARLILAMVIGLGGALFGFITASIIANRAKANANEGALISAFTSRAVEPINPEVDLGSESLDAPIEEIEADEPEEEPADLARSDIAMEALIEPREASTCEAASCEPAEETPQAGFASLTNQRLSRRRDKPRSLDLQEFADAPGRNAVWVEEQPDANSAPSTQAEFSPKSGLEKLRQTPTEDLSLIEMVERFAAALHEHQAKERARLANGDISREAALAETLKALSLFTEAGFDQNGAMRPGAREIGKTQAELRSALARLQNVRGVA